MSHCTGTKADTRLGYSLAELVIVVACAAVLLGAAVPNFIRLEHEWTLLGGARVLEASLQWGRMHAISSNTPLMFEIDDIGKRFYWTDPESGDCYTESIRHFPKGTRITAAPRRHLRFYPRGNAAPAGTYTLAGEAGSYSVIVTPGGRIRLQRN